MLISLSCSCLAAIDQFLITSRHDSLPRYSQMKWAHQILFVMIIVWFLYEIDFLLYFDILFISLMCVNINASFYSDTTINFFLLLFEISAVLLTVFGYLTYRNIHQILTKKSRLLDFNWLYFFNKSFRLCAEEAQHYLQY